MGQICNQNAHKSLVLNMILSTVKNGSTKCRGLSR